jgi:hypothetical protein
VTLTRETNHVNLLCRLSKKIVKLSRLRLGWSKTSTELPVLDFACTVMKRLKREKKIEPRDSSILVYLLSGL